MDAVSSIVAFNQSHSKEVGKSLVGMNCCGGLKTSHLGRPYEALIFPMDYKYISIGKEQKKREPAWKA